MVRTERLSGILVTCFLCVFQFCAMFVFIKEKIMTLEQEDDAKNKKIMALESLVKTLEHKIAKNDSADDNSRGDVNANQSRPGGYDVLDIVSSNQNDSTKIVLKEPNTTIDNNTGTMSREFLLQHISITKPNITTEIKSPPLPSEESAMTVDNVNLLYLEGPPPSGAGLGHSFMIFNHFVMLALENNVSIRTTYETGGHGLKSQNVKKYFFGDQTMTPLPENTTCSRQRTTMQSLPGKVLRARKEQSCVVFTIGENSATERGIGVHLPFYRRLFEGNEVARQSTIERKWKQPSRSDVVHVAVHIRRGDLKKYLRGNLGQTQTRLVHENMYTTILNQLLIKLAELEKYEVDVRLYCEGMKPPASIPKATDWSLVDLREEVIFDSTIQNVTILPGSDNTLQAWDDMCFSDVLITGTSGFSHLASILCKTPVILGVPFWHSYDYIPNAIKLDVGKETIPVPAVGLPNASLTYRASFNKIKFEMLWQERFPRNGSITTPNPTSDRYFKH